MSRISSPHIGSYTAQANSRKQADPTTLPSRIPIPSTQAPRKRAILGERFDNHSESTPSQSTPKQCLKSRIPTSTPRVHFTASSPKNKPKQRQSFAGHTPHPVRLSLGDVSGNDGDMTMLFDVEQPDFESEMSSPMRSQVDSPRVWGRAVMGEGRLMTPADSQEMPAPRQRPNHTPTRHTTTVRLPTPPSSQSNDIPTPKPSKIRPRPTPTPPRRSLPPSSAIEFEIPLRVSTEDISPNPRRKKSPRVVNQQNDTTSPTRSTFTFEIIVPSSRSKSRSPPVSTSTAKGKSRAPRSSTGSRTPSASPALNTSQSSNSSSTKTTETTTTITNPTKRKSLTISRRASTAQTPHKPRARQSLPSKRSSLSAQTPRQSNKRKPPATTSKLQTKPSTRRKSSVGVGAGVNKGNSVGVSKGNVVLDEVLEPDSDGDDPLLLKAVEREEMRSWRKDLERRLGLRGGGVGGMDEGGRGKGVEVMELRRGRDEVEEDESDQRDKEGDGNRIGATLGDATSEAELDDSPAAAENSNLVEEIAPEREDQEDQDDLPSPFLKSSKLPITHRPQPISSETLVDSPPFPSQATFEDQHDLTLGDFDVSNDYDPPMDWASDDGSDDGMGGVGDDTFVHVLARRGAEGSVGELIPLAMRAASTAITEVLAEVDEEAEGSRSVLSPLTPRRKEQVEPDQDTSIKSMTNEGLLSSPASTVVADWVKSPTPQAPPAIPSPTPDRRNVRGSSVPSVYLDCSELPERDEADCTSPTPMRRSKSATPAAQMHATSPTVSVDQHAGSDMEEGKYTSLAVPCSPSLGLRISRSPSPRISRLKFTASTPKAKASSLRGSPAPAVDVAECHSPLRDLETIDHTFTSPMIFAQVAIKDDAPNHAALLNNVPLNLGNPTNHLIGSNGHMPTTLALLDLSEMLRPVDQGRPTSPQSTSAPSSSFSSDDNIRSPASETSRDAELVRSHSTLSSPSPATHVVELGEEIEADSGQWDDIVTPFISSLDGLVGDEVVESDIADEEVDVAVVVDIVESKVAGLEVEMKKPADDVYGVSEPPPLDEREDVEQEDRLDQQLSLKVTESEGLVGEDEVQCDILDTLRRIIAEEDSEVEDLHPESTEMIHAEVGGLSDIVEGIPQGSLETQDDISVGNSEVSSGEAGSSQPEDLAVKTVSLEMFDEVEEAVGSEDGDVTVEGEEEDWEGSVGDESGDLRASVGINEPETEEVYESSEDENKGREQEIDSSSLGSENAEPEDGAEVLTEGADVFSATVPVSATANVQTSPENSPLMGESIEKDGEAEEADMEGEKSTDEHSEEEHEEQVENLSVRELIPLRQPEERIVVKIVDLGRIVKIEPYPDFTQNTSTTPRSSPPLTEATLNALLPGAQIPQERIARESTPAVSERSASQLAQSPKTPSVYPPLPPPVVASSSSAQSHPNSSSTSSLSANQTSDASSSSQPISTPIARNAETIHTLESMLRRRNSSSSSTGFITTRKPSRLSNEVLPSPPHSRPLPRRSLGAELRHAIMAEGNETGREALTSVVEVSSLDPKAAARAAAILKLNHAYIEHGIIPTVHSDQAESSRKVDKQGLLLEAELDLVKSCHRRSRSRSKSVATSRVMGLETEEEEDEDEFEGYVPGGWKATPGKRKRVIRSGKEVDGLPASAVGVELKDTREKVEGEGRAWGVAEWKRLERAYRAEKEEWVKEREVKKLPGMTTSSSGSGWLTFGWGKKTDGGEVKVKEWEVGRVIERFCKGEKVESLVGEWDKEIIRLRVEALEKRVSQPRVPKTPKIDEAPLLKKARLEGSGVAPVTPLKWGGGGIVPPSTIQRMLGFVWSAKPSGASDDAKGKVTREEQAGTKLLDRMEDAREANKLGMGEDMRKVTGSHLNSVVVESRGVREEMREVTGNHSSSAVHTRLVRPETTSTVSTTPRTAPPKSLPLTSTSNMVLSQPMRSAVGSFTSSNASGSSSSSLISASRPSTSETPSLPRHSVLEPAPTPSRSTLTISTTTSTISPSTSISQISLQSSLAQRTTAIRALFPDTPTSNPSTPKSASPIIIPARAGQRESPSVKDLVRSFEEGGILARSMDKGKGKDMGDALRKVQSRGV